ncbi:MAG TPA: hypothetical protein VFX33_12880 [Actinomycetales bacterium]|nr:hypothetical protein [Actinomycetales bacterium]
MSAGCPGAPVGRGVGAPLDVDGAEVVVVDGVVLLVPGCWVPAGVTG